MLARRRTRWHPTDLEHVIGDASVIERLQQEVIKAVQRNKPLPHMCIDGYPGLGKATMAKTLATCVNRLLLRTSGPQLDGRDLMELLGHVDPAGYNQQFDLVDPVLARPWVMLVEDADLLTPEMVDNVRCLLRPNRAGRFSFEGMTDAGEQMRCSTTAGTVIFATSHPDRLNELTVEEFNGTLLRITLRPYTLNQMVLLVRQYAHAIGVQVDDAVAHALACRSCGTPRVAVALFDKAYDQTKNRLRGEGSKVFRLDLDVLDEICNQVNECF